MVINGYVSTCDSTVDRIKLWMGDCFRYDIQEYENIIFFSNKIDPPAYQVYGEVFLKTSNIPEYANIL